MRSRLHLSLSFHFSFNLLDTSLAFSQFPSQTRARFNLTRDKIVRFSKPSTWINTKVQREKTLALCTRRQVRFYLQRTFVKTFQTRKKIRFSKRCIRLLGKFKKGAEPCPFELIYNRRYLFDVKRVAFNRVSNENYSKKTVYLRFKTP